MLTSRGLALGVLLAAAACSSDPPEQKPVPSSEVVRDLYGLGPGSCYRYRQLGSGLFATFDIAGPNTTSIAGRTVFVRKYSLDAGGRAVEESFATDGDGEIRLLRKVDDQATVKRYELDTEAPLFAKYQFNSKNEAIMKIGDTFSVTATPKDMPAEDHEWTVLNDKAMAAVLNGEQKTAYELQYRINSASPSKWLVVPGFGVANFTDVAGTTHQVCDARVCDSAGTCTGEHMCDQLNCNQ